MASSGTLNGMCNLIVTGRVTEGIDCVIGFAGDARYTLTLSEGKVEFFVFFLHYQKSKERFVHCLES